MNKMLIVKIYSGRHSTEEQCFVLDKPLRLHFTETGQIKMLEPTSFCKTCEGSGGVCYHYDCDSSVSVDCPTCNNGDKKRWEKEKRNWEDKDNGR